jgi:hypothetical protein
MRDDALPLQRVVVAGGLIALAVAIVIGVVLAILHGRGVPVGGQAVAKPDPLEADLPMLQSAPQADLAAYRKEKSRELNELGWVDAASGVAHVPIDVAMALLVQRAASAPASATRGGGS